MIKMKMNSIINRNFMTANEVSSFLRIPLRTIYNLSKAGKINGVKIGKQWRYHKKDIEQYLNFGTDFSKEPTRKPDNFIERRSYHRINSNFKCQYSINLPPFKNINSEGIVKDLSAGGILLVNQDDRMNKIKVNDPVDLDFALISKYSLANINTEGKIVRINSNEIGIKFRNISSDDRNKLIQYVG